LRALRRGLLAFDAFIDSAMFDAGRRALAGLSAVAAASERLNVRGLPKLGFDLACEAANVGLVGLVVALMLAQPAFKATADEDWLKRTDFAVTFLDRYGAEIGRRGVKRDESVPFDELPEFFVKEVLATEDRRFFHHFGVDVVGSLRALTVNAHAGGVVQGGSTITQQLAKNVFLSNERSISRKITEAFLALWLEHHLSKKQILSLYLDRVYMGGGTFGVEAAARHYFGKSIRDVNLAEGAMLAGLFKAPTKFSPGVNLPAARARANDVLSNLVDAGFMTEAQVYSARRNPATPVDETEAASPNWYLDFAFNEVKQLAANGKLGPDRALTVRTGLDQDIQQKAEDVLEEKLRVDAPAYHAHQAATVIADTDGLVRAMVGGRDYGASQFNRATDALRQPGSSFKVFDYLTALLTGKFHPNTPVDASPICIGDYCVHNYHGEHGGRMPMYRALALSYNTAAIWLSWKIGEAYWPPGKPFHMAKMAALGRSKIVETARLLGLTTPLPDTVSLPVGADEVKMIDMVGVNATLANGGHRVTPHAAVEIRNSEGKLIYAFARNGTKPDQIVPPDKVAEMNNIMIHVVTEGTGRAAQIPGRAIAGKTGTTNNSTNAWFNAFTGNLVGSVWFGNDDTSPMGELTGGVLPAQSWHDIMVYALRNLEPKPPFGVAAPAAPAALAGAGKDGAAGAAGPPARAFSLSPQTGRALLDLADFLRAAQNRAEAAPAPQETGLANAAPGGRPASP
jgi:penicillin-binding protein 1A